MFEKTSPDGKREAGATVEEKEENPTVVVDQGPCDTVVVEEEGEETDPDTTAPPPPPYSDFTNGQKIGTTLMVSFLAIISPLSGQIYLPALNSLAESLNVPVSYISLTITTFMVSPPLPFFPLVIRASSRRRDRSLTGGTPTP